MGNKIKAIVLTFIIVTATILVMRFFEKGGLPSALHSTEKETTSLDLNKLRGVTKLVIWEQDFTLNHEMVRSRDFVGIFKTKEKVFSRVKGEMGFHIDLADSIKTQIINTNDSIIILAPLQNTYIELDLASLEQVKESSWDPLLNLKKIDVVKGLRKAAIEYYIPNIKEQLSERSIKEQENYLSRLVGKKVSIQISAYPTPQEVLIKKR